MSRNYFTWKPIFLFLDLTKKLNISQTRESNSQLVFDLNQILDVKGKEQRKRNKW